MSSAMVRFAKLYRLVFAPKPEELKDENARECMRKHPFCWIWKGKLKDGYGRIRVHGTITRAHRYAYVTFRGDIPKDRPDLDHLCRRRACVNPDHLEPTTNYENTMRGENFAARNKVKTKCPRAHEYTITNTYVDGRGRRYCRTCARERKRAKAA